MIISYTSEFFQLFEKKNCSIIIIVIIYRGQYA